MSDLKLSGYLGLGQIELPEDFAPSGGADVADCGPLANEVLRALEKPEHATEQSWLGNMTQAAPSGELMRTAAVVEAISGRLEGPEAVRVKAMLDVVKRYGELEALVLIRSSTLKP